MFSPAFKARLATALAGAALASALVVSGASASHGYQPAQPSADVPPPPSSIAVSAAEEYQDLRAPDTRDLAEPSEPSGFDFVSAAIGAIGAGAVALVLMAALGLRRPPRGRPASA